jgi:RNA polymerase sigma-70 factor (ECF subfamily)
MTDQEQMVRIRRGDSEAMRVLFDRHHPGLFGFFVGRGATPDRAEDLVQDVFVRIWRYRDTFDPERPFLPWMYRIARNALAGLGDFPDTQPLEKAAEVSGANPVEELEAAERAAVVRRAVRGLPETQREVLLLSRWSGMNYREIGELVGCSEGAVKVRVFRALETLRRTLAPLREDLR